MKYVYLAVFTKENGKFLVSVPDLHQAEMSGINFSNALQNALIEQLQINR